MRKYLQWHICGHKQQSMPTCMPRQLLRRPFNPLVFFILYKQLNNISVQERGKQNLCIILRRTAVPESSK